MRAYVVCAVLCVSLGTLRAGESPQSAPEVVKRVKRPATPKTIESLELFQDADAGYSLRIPEGFTKLTAAESKEVFRGIGEYLGKQAGERALRRPPAWFKGPTDPNNTKLLPPSLAIGYTDMPEPIDPTQLDRYKRDIEDAYRRSGQRHGETKVGLVIVSGVTSLKIEDELYSPVDNSPARIVNLAVPGSGRRYDIVFNFSSEQEQLINASVDTIVRSFKVEEQAFMTPQEQSRWVRVAVWTIGGFVIGVLLSLLLRVLAGIGERSSGVKP